MTISWHITRMINTYKCLIVSSHDCMMCSVPHAPPECNTCARPGQTGISWALFLCVAKAKTASASCSLKPLEQVFVSIFFSCYNFFLRLISWHRKLMALCKGYVDPGRIWEFTIDHVIWIINDFCVFFLTFFEFLETFRLRLVWSLKLKMWVSRSPLDR